MLAHEAATIFPVDRSMDVADVQLAETVLSACFVTVVAEAHAAETNFAALLIRDTEDEQAAETV